MDGSGRQPFEWDPIPGGLPQNFLYELVFWEKADANPLRSARSPVGAGEATRVLVDLGAADGRLDHVVDPGQDTCWGVRLWNTSMNRPEQMLSDSCRLFTYTGTGGQGAGSETGGVPSGGRN